MRSGSIRGRALVVVAVVLAACGGSAATVGDDARGTGTDAGGIGGGDKDAAGGGNGDAGGDSSMKSTTKVPVNHRATAVACSHDRGPGDADQSPNPIGDCTKDADCTAGTNGRCNYQTVAARITHCSYDTCFTDADCGAKVCSCRETASATNRCEAGNCKIDADCGAGGYCSPSVDFDKINFGTTGYWCHVAADTCVDDADCSKDGGAQAKCAWDAKTSHWACSSMGFYPP